MSQQRHHSQCAFCVDEPPAGLSAVVVDIRLSVAQAPQIERPAGPHPLQALIELLVYVVITTEESRHTHTSPDDQTAR